MRPLPSLGRPPSSVEIVGRRTPPRDAAPYRPPSLGGWPSEAAALPAARLDAGSLAGGTAVEAATLLTADPRGRDAEGAGTQLTLVVMPPAAVSDADAIEEVRR